MSDTNNENIENEEELDNEKIEDSSEKEKSNVPQISPKVNKTPSFPNQNRFGKGAFNNSFNNRQRPGRAASRGR